MNKKDMILTIEWLSGHEQFLEHKYKEIERAVRTIKNTKKSFEEIDKEVNQFNNDLKTIRDQIEKLQNKCPHKNRHNTHQDKVECLDCGKIW